jgi:DNA polymerase-1
MGPADGKKRLFLIDGNSLLYRSYYAIQKLSNSRGFPTNGIYGFISTLRKIMENEKPDYLGVVFDAKGPTVRHDDFKDYKANRKPMPDDLAVQLPVLKEVLAALRIPTVELSTYEADDVLATLAAKAAARDVHSVIVTTDKDLLQVVDDSTSVWNPAKEVYITPANVAEFFGVPASRVVDVLALWGDPTDNVPGVPGIGEKTAKALIREHGSLDDLLRHLDRIKNPRLREAIAKNRDLLDLSRRLVSVHPDLDLELDLGLYAPHEPDADRAIGLFQELEFTSFAQELLGRSAPAEETRYRAVFDEAELASLVDRIRRAKAVALDTETDNTSPVRARLVGISFSVVPGEAFYIPLGHDYLGAPVQIPKKRALELMKGVLEDPDVRKTGQNIKYDWIVLKREGVELRGVDLDTMVLSYLLEPNWGKHNLEKLALVYLRAKKTPYEEVAGRGKAQATLDRVAVERVCPYACQDADLAGRLGPLLWKKVRERGLARLYEEVERPLIELLARMEMWGVRVDQAVLREISAALEAELRGLEKEIHELAGGAFNINSPGQLADVLVHKCGLSLGRKTKGGGRYSTSLDVLEEVAPQHPIARLVLDYRQMAKLKSTYADALPALVNPETGRIHTSYNQTVAATGRLSSSDPNLQNIPARGEWGARFRKAFVADPGRVLLAADYSQIELRILAHLSADPVLVDTFLNDRDVHDETARLVFGDRGGLAEEETRRRAKVINFSVIYGTSAFSLARELGTSNSEAQRFIDRYFEKHPGVKECLDRLVEEARTRGWSETMFGRRRQVPELQQADRATREAGRRIALNTPIQGSAADLIKVAMLRIWEDLKARGLRSRMILQVHDELLFEVPLEEKETVGRLVRERMENVLELRVPLKVKLGWGPTWADAK